MNPTVTVILINWNGWKDTIECLESLYQINYPNYNVILVDNNSKDDSIQKIKEYCRGNLQIESEFFKYNPSDKPIEIQEYTKGESEKGLLNKEFLSLSSNRKLILIRSPENYGFSEGNNIGIRYALNNLDNDYILLLNNDTVVDNDFLAEMVNVGESKRKFGILGPKTFYYDFSGKKDVICFAGGLLNMNKGQSHSIGSNEIDNGQYDEIKEVNYVEGSCLLIKKEVLNKIGFLDTRYFAYWEETDFCIRGFNAGYKSVYVSKAKIWHKVSASFNNPIKLYYYTRNKFWFMKKNGSKKQYISFLFNFFLYSFWRLNFDYFYDSLKFKKDFNRNKNFTKGSLHGLLRNN